MNAFFVQNKDKTFGRQQMSALRGGRHEPKRVSARIGETEGSADDPDGNGGSNATQAGS